MTITIDGVALDNPSLGWVLRAMSKPVPTVNWDRADLRVNGKAGVVAGLPILVDAPTVELVVQTPKTNLAALMTLVTRGAHLADTDRTGQRVRFEVIKFEPDEFGDIIDARFLLRYPAVYWRDDTDTTTPPTSISGTSVTMSGFLPGISAPIEDAVIRVKGSVSGLVVSDHGGSWFSVDGTVGASEWLRFEAATGRAFITTADAWVGGTETSDRVDYSSDGFQIAPYWTGSPDTRSGRVTISTQSRSGTPTIEIRAKGAHVV